MVRRRFTRLFDKFDLGASRLVPRKWFEGFTRRHARRLSVNLAARHLIHAWCDSRGIDLKVIRNGRRWVFRWNGQMAEWCPNTARLVINRRRGESLHCHDYVQLTAYLDDQWRVAEREKESACSTQK